VILEELAMAGDDPVDVAHEQIATAVLGEHPLGRPIGGTPATIRAVPREAVLAHYRRTYVPGELVVTAAGAVDHDELCRQVLAAVRAGGWQLDPAGTPVERRSTGAAELPAAGRALTLRRSTEQSNVILGCPGLTARDERRWALS